MHKLARTVFMVMAFAAPAIAAAEPTRLLMQPDIHGDRVVFRHGGDLWIASVQGGTARRLTTSDGVETTPRFSPDGSRIAFTGQYDSNEDVYVVPASGGEPVRVTFHPGDDILRDWTPDGTALLFASGRENPPAFVHRLWTIAAAGGRQPRTAPIRPKGRALPSCRRPRRFSRGPAQGHTWGGGSIAAAARAGFAW
jgi:tricorn protease